MKTNEEKPCCTICDQKKKCYICGEQTLYACSDCRIDFNVSIYVCKSSSCRDTHELKCSHCVIEKTIKPEPTELGEPFRWMRSWLEAYKKEGDIDVDKIMNWIYKQPMGC